MRILFIFFSFVFFSLGFSQQSLKNSNWMFGGTNIGPNVPQTPGPSLNFINCSPLVENDSPGAQFEGQTAISDSITGNLLFYSCGNQVRNALGQLMPNGNIVGTSNSISQNLIVKKPGVNSIYYLFTPETQAGAIISTANPGLNGFSYSIIDMSLSGGLGAVVSNGNLLQPFQNCEMVTGVYHDNGQDIWIIGHKYGSNTFFVYLLTSSGISSTPVYSNVGPTIVTSGTSNYASSNYDAVGELKASPDGTKLAFTTFYNGFTCLFSFDKTNGAVSNPIPLSLGSAGYGTSFSPDNTKLYFSRVDATQGGISFLNNGSLVQFDISSNNQAVIQSSMYVVFSSTTGFRSLKLGPNGKLYVARTTLTNGGNGSSYLAVINNPNQSGAACNFVNDGVFIGLNRGRWGLNNVIEEFYSCSGFNFTLGADIYKCPESSITLSAPPNQVSYLWNTGATTANLTVTQPGSYWVTVTGPSGAGSDTIVVNNFPTPTLNITGGIDLCPGNTANLVASPNFTNYQWNNGIQTQNNNVGPGTYWLTATDSNACITTDTITVLQLPAPVINIIGDTNVCEGYTTELTASPSLTNYQWSNGLQTPNNFVGPGTYWLTTAYPNGCVASDTFTVIELPNPVVSIIGDTNICEGYTTELTANPNFTNYQWNNGVQTQNNLVGPGTYWLTITDSNGCVVTDTTTVVQIQNPEISFFGSTFICTGQEAFLQATTGFTSYQWSNGLTTANVSLGAGLYSLTVVDSLGCQAIEEITVIGSTPTAEISTSTTFTNINDPIELQSTSTAGLFPISSWYWNFGDGNVSNLENPIHTYEQTGIYNLTLVVMDELGCLDTTIYVIEFEPDFIFYIPNTFTPDGDGLNQNFSPIFSSDIDPYNYQMLIFNRWGEVIFETLDPSIGWDGSFSLDGNPCQSGTYTYMVSIKVPSRNEQKMISGHVNLLR